MPSATNCGAAATKPTNRDRGREILSRAPRDPKTSSKRYHPSSYPSPPSVERGRPGGEGKVLCSLRSRSVRLDPRLRGGCCVPLHASPIAAAPPQDYSLLNIQPR